jgi:lycopene beta-cyclase
MVSAQHSVSSHLVLVGGGLANGLIAWRLQQTRPDISVTVLERGERLGGNHTWSFHETDVPPSSLAWLKPLFSHIWHGQSVRFHDRSRAFSTPYLSVTSEQFHAVVSKAMGQRLKTGVAVADVRPNAVTCSDGTIIPADGVIDARGGVPRTRLELGWQKFLGLEVETEHPHVVRLPVIMDAVVDQSDGFRFIYVLPLSDHRLLIEDTRYTNTSAFQARDLCEEVLVYAANQGWGITKILRHEAGALPIVIAGDIDGLCSDMAHVAKAGLAAGLFHPTTGYSLPDAVRLADLLAASPVLNATTLPSIVQQHARKLWKRRGIYRLVNRMLFHAAAPLERRQVLSHFYRLPQGLVERFYGDRLTVFDKARILSGRPPIPIPRAVGAILKGAAGRLQMVEQKS